MLRLNLIGGGQVGKTFASLLTRHADFTLQCVLNRSLGSAKSACDFIQQGKPITDYHELTPADCYLITVPDQHIIACTEKLVAAKILAPQNLVIHCSGFMSSSALDAATSQGALIASMHPVKSFVDPILSVKTFEGTFCALEGDPRACRLLTGWLKKIGGLAFPINASEKTIYHAALVIASNYMVVLHEMALRSLEKAGVPAGLNNQILAPIMRHTLEQSLSFGTAKALSGPIARGDCAVVAEELAALGQWEPQMGDLYQALGKVALQLAQRQGLRMEQVEEMARVLEK